MTVVYLQHRLYQYLEVKAYMKAYGSTTYWPNQFSGNRIIIHRSWVTSSLIFNILLFFFCFCMDTLGKTESMCGVDRHLHMPSMPFALTIVAICCNSYSSVVSCSGSLLELETSYGKGCDWYTLRVGLASIHLWHHYTFPKLTLDIQYCCHKLHCFPQNSVTVEENVFWARIYQAF